MLRPLLNADMLNYEKLIDMNTLEPVVPVVCVDSKLLAIEGLAAYRMQGFANREAIQLTLETQKATFYSRSKGGLWTKGETSGNFLVVRAAFVDCDYDSVLLDVEARGPTCHNGTASCFQTVGIGE